MTIREELQAAATDVWAKQFYLDLIERYNPHYAVVAKAALEEARLHVVTLLRKAADGGGV